MSIKEYLNLIIGACEENNAEVISRIKAYAQRALKSVYIQDQILLNMDTLPEDEARFQAGYSRGHEVGYERGKGEQPGLPPLPEPILTDEDVKDWEGEKRQPGAVWVKSDYDRLYDQVKSGKRTACYVDYTARGVDRVYRDICSIHPDGMEFVARGIGYGSVKYLEGDEKANFIGLCKIKNVEWLDESGTAAPEWDSVRLIGRVKERFKELEEKQHDWRSFYIGWLEGRVDMLQQIKGYGRLSQDRADFIREANNRDLEGTAAGREEDAVSKEVIDFIRDIAENWDCDEDGNKYNTGCRKCSASELYYELSKQQKEK